MIGLCVKPFLHSIVKFATFGRHLRRSRADRRFPFYSRLRSFVPKLSSPFLTYRSGRRVRWEAVTLFKKQRNLFQRVKSRYRSSKYKCSTKVYFMEFPLSCKEVSVLVTDSLTQSFGEKGLLVTNNSMRKRSSGRLH